LTAQRFEPTSAFSVPVARISRLTVFGFVQLCASTVIFILAASAAKAWTLAPGFGKLALTLVLYTLGNLVMLRLIRDFGLGVAISLSAVIQLIAVNLVAFAFFGERVDVVQGTGILIAILAVALVTAGPYITGR
jgi:multidrug transporter EmrE-like cation transporter